MSLPPRLSQLAFSPLFYLLGIYHALFRHEKPGEREKPCTPYPLPLSTPATQANKKDDPTEIGNYRLISHLLSQTRTQSLFNICLGGERRLGVRLRRAGSHGKGPLSMSPRKRLNLFPNLLSPPKHINNDWVRVGS